MRTTSDSLFSIGIPTHNRRDMLCQAIRSALNQSYPNIEIIISDNASNDGTADAVAAFRDSRIRYVRNDINLGGSANWERCVHLARGHFFSWLQDDDLLLPGFVDAAVHALAKVNADCCIAACIQTSSPSSLSGATVFGTVTTLDWGQGSHVTMPLEIALPLAVFESSGIPPAMAFRAPAIRRIVSDLCHTAYPLYAERMLVVRCAQFGKVVLVPMFGGIYRSHPEQQSRAMLFHTKAARKQYESFLMALEEIQNSRRVPIANFADFLRRAPDKVLDRFYSFVTRRRSAVRYFAEVGGAVKAEYSSREISAAKYRIWRVCQDLAPPMLVRFLVGPIQCAAKKLGIRLVM